jgi:hypothetical protein
MLFESPLFSKASGSLAGTTFSHNRGGMYTRARVTPTNPSSEYQQAVRSAMSTLASHWGQQLSSGERDAWNSYAASVAMTNRLGAQVYLTGQQHFLRSNVPRLQAGIAVLEVAPVVYDLGSYTLPAIANAEDDGAIGVSFTNADAWANAVGGYMLVYQSRPQGPGKSFFKGPFRYIGKVSGAVSPPTSPFSGTSPFALSIDQLIWIATRFVQVDGRLSSQIVLGPYVVTEAA